MPSPITGDNFAATSVASDLCSLFRDKLLTNAQIKQLLDYMFNSDGTPTCTFKADLRDPPLYAIATGVPNTYLLDLVTANPCITSYSNLTGRIVVFEANFTNTDVPYINVSSFGARNLVLANGATIDAGMITSGTWYAVFFDGTNFYALTLPIIPDLITQSSGIADFSVPGTGTVTTKPHGLSARPQVVEVTLVVKAGETDLGWTEGQEVRADAFVSHTVGGGNDESYPSFSVGIDDNNIIITTDYGGIVPKAPSKTTGNHWNDMDPTKWQMRIKAFRYNI